MNLSQYIGRIEPANKLAMEQAQKRWNSIAKPLNSLGLLEKAVIQLAGIYGTSQVNLNKRAVVVMCADNGVVDEGVTQVSNEVTAIVTENFTKGETSVNNMANVARADVIPVDIGVARKVEGSGLVHKKILFGTANMAHGPAMAREHAVQAIEVGINLVKELKEQGYNIIATGEMGIGNTTTSSAMTAVLLDQDVEHVTGRGAGLSSSGLEKKIAVIKQAIDLNQPKKDDAIDVLAKVGGLDIAGLVGVFLGGAIYRVPIIIDGFISGVAALTASKICPTAKEYALPSHISNEPAGQLLMDALEMKPIIHAQMCLGEGTGAVAILPILDMALEVYNKMSSFEDIEIDAYEPLD